MTVTLDTVSILKQLVSIRSVYPDEHEISRWIQQFLEQLGYNVELVITDGSRPNLVATFGESAHYIAFYGHMDTVPPASDYQRDPFTVEQDGDILRGLGVCDMKGGLTCILQAAAWAAQERLPVKVIFGVDEEDISQGAHDLVDSGLLSDVAFLIVAESGQIVDYNQPMSVCLGRKGRLVFEVEVRGRSAHAAESHKGINAIEKATHLIQEIVKLEFPEHPRLGKTAVVVQGIQAQSSAFSVPDQCTINLSLLTTPGVLGVDFEKRILQLGGKLGIDLSIQPKSRKTPYGDACEINREDPFYQKLEQELFLPLNIAPIYTPSVADENVFANRLKIPVLTIGVIGGGDHTKDEWSKLSTFSTVIESYKKAIALWSAT